MMAIAIPEGVEFVEIAKESGAGYILSGEYVYGSSTHPFSPGSIVVKPAEGYEFVYDIRTDGWDAVKKLAAPKRLAITLVVTNERDLEKLKRVAPQWPGYVSIEELPSEPGPAPTLASEI